MIVLVVGPSGVGKSDYGKYAEETISGCQFFDLDSLVHKRSGTPAGQLLRQIRNDAFLDICQQEVDDLLQSCPESVTVVAVGAGALQSDHADAWLSRHPGPTIAVVAAPDEVYRRGGPRNGDRTLDEFIAVELLRVSAKSVRNSKIQMLRDGASIGRGKELFHRHNS